MIKEYQFTFEELLIGSSDLEELMGFEKGEIPEPFPELINNAIANAPQFCNIKGGYKIFESVLVDSKLNSIQIKHYIFLPGKIVVTQLKKATSAAIFTCTAGSEISIHSKTITEGGDPLLGYVYDIIGSVTVEKAMDKIQNELKAEMGKPGLNISDRYSPGYCDWSVAEQQKLFALLPEKFCGVSLSLSSLMSPIKSVSGIIGIGTEVEQKGYQCLWCNNLNCIYGKIKRKKISKQKL